MQHKNIIITGATDGIGLAAAKSIAKKGCHVSLVGRNPDKGKKALETIIAHSGNENLNFFECDLSLAANVKDLADRIKQKHSKIDVLLNNAGGANKTKQITSEGLEKTFATNQMNYFVLSTELLDILSESNDGRIVNVASNAHIGAEIDYENINSEKSFSAWTSYCVSKLMNIMFTYQLASMQDKVSVNVLHPGFVDTNIAGNEGNLIKYIVKFGAKIFARTVDNGADSSIYLSTSNEVKGVSGKYFFKCREIKSSRASYNQEDWKKVWNLCEDFKKKLI
ncbi:MAG: SDR family oxidoreductase [Candidatus Marinimicrobia bacterium]|nr:SDR family oxidoreductase [Candidatus Neomarinimicrobiota bacterium]MDA0753626.1 SDR family oxidoreductase [Candidatus Neomarinimicrobiota bacterium]MDA1363662.1 SDR family oxidoreductase [Candidatus Neomarinimicrobiota bacterium]